MGRHVRVHNRRSTVGINAAPTDKLYPVTGIATVVKCLMAEGIASPDALTGVQLSLAQLHSPETRVSLNQVVRCYQNASRLVPARSFAFQTGLHFHISTYGIYGFVILSSTDFRKTARFAERYHQLATPVAHLAFSEQDGDGIWRIEPAPLPGGDATLYRFIIELHFGIGVSLHRAVMGRSFVPRELRLRYGPSKTGEPLADVFGCPVRFAQPDNALVFDRKWLDEPAVLGNELTYMQLIKLCDELLEEMQLKTGFAGVVREALLANLAQPMSIASLSRQLKISTRTVKRKLREEGTSYRKIVGQLRMELAIKYLRDTQLTVDEIASCLAFSDAANFRHAFRRLTGQTPSRFRPGTAKAFQHRAAEDRSQQIATQNKRRVSPSDELAP